MIWVSLGVQVAAYVLAGVVAAALIRERPGGYRLAVGAVLGITCVAVALLVPAYKGGVERLADIRSGYSGLTDDEARARCMEERGVPLERPFAWWVRDRVPTDAFFTVRGAPVDTACLTYIWLPRRPATEAEDLARAWEVVFAEKPPPETRTSPDRVEKFAPGRWLIRPAEGES
jgi:hypothetical protein